MAKKKVIEEKIPELSVEEVIEPIKPILKEKISISTPRGIKVVFPFIYNPLRACMVRENEEITDGMYPPYWLDLALNPDEQKKILGRIHFEVLY